MSDTTLWTPRSVKKKGENILSAAHGWAHAGAGGYFVCPMEGPHPSRLILKGCSPWRGPLLMKESGEERSAERNSYKPTRDPILNSSALLRGKEIEELGIKEWDWLKKTWGEGVCICFSVSKPTLTIPKISFPQVDLFWP